jgi:hypothetical protein
LALEQLTCAEIAGSVGISTEAARAVARRCVLPRSQGNDGKTWSQSTLQKFSIARCLRGRHAVTKAVTPVSEPLPLARAFRELVEDLKSISRYRPSKKSIKRMVETLHALTIRTGTWQETTELVARAHDCPGGRSAGTGRTLNAIVATGWTPPLIKRSRSCRLSHNLLKLYRRSPPGRSTQPTAER